MIDYEGFEEHMIDEEKAENTIESYIYALKEYAALFDELNKANILSYKKWLLDKKAPSTVNLRLAGVNQYLKYIKKDELCVKRVRTPQKVSVENVITIDEYNALKKGLQEDGDYAGYFLVQYMAHTGARVSELINITKNDVNNGYFEMWTKGKIRRIYLPQSLIKESKEFIAGKEKYIFLNRYGERITTRGVTYKIKKYAARYDIRREVMHPHSFRHLFAIEFLKRDSNLALLADLMGHSSINTTAIYTRMSREEQKRRLEEAMDW